MNEHHIPARWPVDPNVHGAIARQGRGQAKPAANDPTQQEREIRAARRRPTFGWAALAAITLPWACGGAGLWIVWQLALAWKAVS